MDYIISFEVDITSTTRISQILQHVAPLNSGFIWAERHDAWTFSKWRGVDATLQVCRAGENIDEASFSARGWLDKSHCGRWFNHECQMTWRRMLIGDDDIVRVVSLTSDASCAESFKTVIGTSKLIARSTNELGLTDCAEEYLLWGQQTVNSPGRWIDLSIPHRLSYPLPSPGPAFVSLAAKRWHDSTGRTHFLRYTDLVAANHVATPLDVQTGASQ